MDLLRRPDIVDQLAMISAPVLVCVGQLDPITPVTAAEEIMHGLSDDCGQLEVIPGAGHFPWKDAPKLYWPLLERFLANVSCARPANDV